VFDVTVKSAKISLRVVLLALIIGVISASPASALRVNFTKQGDADKLTFSFDSESLPEVKVQRTGKEAIRISLPENIWETEPQPGGKDYPGKLIKTIRAVPGGVELVTRTNAFGYIKVPVSGKPQFVLQVYRDPIGARWEPPALKAAPQPDPKVETKTAPVPPQPAQTPATPTPSPAAQTAEQKQAASQPVQAPIQQAEADLPAEGEQRKPFFSVPYSVRNEVTPPGQGAPADGQPVVQPVQPAPQTATPAPETETGVYPPSSELRFKVVDKSAEDVKFAELSGNDAGSPPIANQVGGAVGGVVQQPAEQASPQQVQQPIVQPVQEPDSGAVGGAIAPPQGESVQQVVSPEPVQQSVVSQAVEQPTGAVGGAVAPPPGSVSGQGQVGGSVAPPPTVVEGAPPPQATPDEAQAELTVAQQIAQQEGGQVAPPPAEVEENPVPQENEAAEGTESAVEGEEGAPAEVPQLSREEQIRNQLYEAQSLMFNGALSQALPIYEDILKQLDVPDDVREETLFAVADIKKEIHKDQLDEYFSEISQAYIEAMNNNQRSNRVPRSLLNLGLINLQVGNFPEAKAYFKILQERFPDDDNIPSISYYWGEYYYKKGDYKKAADQFQYLIQTYPEHELVKQAAYFLADSLNRTGFIEQAFQIVDYIDKRWPDYYMENPQFLRLAGGVEMKLKKWDAAKDHYFTYYNLNPEQEGADIVLARLGDLYIRQGEKEAARQIYQKVIEDFPDKEGGLVAKMRLAEEGIYDEPTLSDMASVFNRPYNKRPENIYREIIEKHPDSRLAPIAQLKLAMWYGYNKKYPEALAAAQDFIEKYPDNQFVPRARRLGDSVFALAVPGMVEEGRFGRVIRYWETYDFIGQKDTKVDDETRLNVALSYWKIGQPQKALAILKPYLGGRQKSKISEEALGLAVNIYLDELAWKEIADLIAMAKKDWKLKPEQLRQLDYARAMSLQNLGKDSEAQVLWAELAKDVEVEPAFRAYAMYYMAKAAMEKQDLRRVFVYSQEALTLLLQTKGDPEKIKDAVLMSIYATERSGRYQEALKWAKQYDEYIDVDNPEWASTRFKLARIYRKAGAIEEWKQLLTDIIEKKPETLQAQLAKSALDTYDLEQQIQQYNPAPQ